MPENELHDGRLYGWERESDLAKVQRLLREHPEWAEKPNWVRAPRPPLLTPLLLELNSSIHTQSPEPRTFHARSSTRSPSTCTAPCHRMA